MPIVPFEKSTCNHEHQHCTGMDTRPMLVLNAAGVVYFAERAPQAEIQYAYTAQPVERHSSIPPLASLLWHAQKDRPMATRVRIKLSSEYFGGSKSGTPHISHGKGVPTALSAQDSRLKAHRHRQAARKSAARRAQPACEPPGSSLLA